MQRTRSRTPPSRLRAKRRKGSGKATDDDKFDREGHGDQAKGNLKQPGEKVKDAFKK